MERDVVKLTSSSFGFEIVDTEYIFGGSFLSSCFVLVLAFSNLYACKASYNQPGLGRPSTPIEDNLENQYIRAIFFQLLDDVQSFPQHDLNPPTHTCKQSFR